MLQRLTREIHDAQNALNVFYRRQSTRWSSQATTFVFMRELQRLHMDVDELRERGQLVMKGLRSLGGDADVLSALSVDLEALTTLQDAVMRPTCQVG